MSLECLLVGRNTRDYSIMINDHNVQSLKRLKLYNFYKILYDRMNINSYVKKRRQIQIHDQKLGVFEALNFAINTLNKDGTDPQNYSLAELPNLTTIYLHNYLRINGITNVKRIDVFDYELESLTKILVEEKPLAIAISSTFYISPVVLIEVIQFIKKHNTEAKIIVGGSGIYDFCEEFKDRKRLIPGFLKIIGADFYVIEPQGEQALVMIIEKLKTGKTDSHEIPNIYYEKEDKGFVFSSVNPENISLTGNSIDWYKHPLDNDISIVRTSRGCPYRCAFCQFPWRSRNQYERLSIEEMETQLLALKKLGVKYINFIDDTFNVPESRFEKILNMMLENRFDFKWYSYFRCGSVKDKRIFKLMKESGCIAVFLGIESGDDEMLKRMNKQETVEGFKYGISCLKEQGILVLSSLICGFPGETLGTMRNTVDFINEARPDFYSVLPWYYDHNTPIHKQREKYKITGEGTFWKHATMDSEYAWNQGLDYFFHNITGSIQINLAEFEMSLSYLLSKGFTIDQYIDFCMIIRDLLTFNGLHKTSLEDPVVMKLKKDTENRLINLAKRFDLKESKYPFSIKQQALLDQPEYFDDYAKASYAFFNEHIKARAGTIQYTALKVIESVLNMSSSYIKKVNPIRN